MRKSKDSVEICMFGQHVHFLNNFASKLLTEKLIECIWIIQAKYESSEVLNANYAKVTSFKAKHIPKLQYQFSFEINLYFNCNDKHGIPWA